MEPVNFLQSPILKINQEYIGCIKDAVMDMQDTLVFDNDDFTSNGKYESSQLCEDQRLVQTGSTKLDDECTDIKAEITGFTYNHNNNDTVRMELSGVNLEKTEVTDGENIIIETSVQNVSCKDATFLGAEEEEMAVTKKTRFADSMSQHESNVSSDDLKVQIVQIDEADDGYCEEVVDLKDSCFHLETKDVLLDHQPFETRSIHLDIARLTTSEEMIEVDDEDDMNCLEIIAPETTINSIDVRSDCDGLLIPEDEEIAEHNIENEIDGCSELSLSDIEDILPSNREEVAGDECKLVVQDNKKGTMKSKETESESDVNIDLDRTELESEAKLTEEKGVQPMVEETSMLEDEGEEARLEADKNIKFEKEENIEPETENGSRLKMEEIGFAGEDIRINEEGSTRLDVKHQVSEAGEVEDNYKKNRLKEPEVESFDVKSPEISTIKEIVVNEQPIVIPKINLELSPKLIVMDELDTQRADDLMEAQEQNHIHMQVSSEVLKAGQEMETVIPKSKYNTDTSEVVELPTVAPEDIEELPKLIPIQAMQQATKNNHELPPELILITKPNHRLYMAQLIERKLQGELEDYNYQNGEKSAENSPTERLHTEQVETWKGSSLKSNHETDRNNIERHGRLSRDSSNVKVNEEAYSAKKPIIGCVRKSERKTERLTKPPWLVENERCTGDDNEGQDGVNEDPGVSNKVDQLQEGDLIEEVNLINLDNNEVLTNGIDMREKLASQLQMLKVKKTTSLFDAKIPDFSVTHHEKRVLKSGPSLSDFATVSPSPLGLKIVAVAGGMDLESCRKRMSCELDLNPLRGCLIEEEHLEGSDKSSDSIMKEVIINDHLDLPTIKLTKTKDYKKIKGWSKKKLLTLDTENIECIESDKAGETGVEGHDELEVMKLNVDNVDQGPTPSCSYAAQADVEPEPNSPDGNVFSSNSLDGFLQEKDLNISYNVPNLKSTNHNINLLDACMLVDIEGDRMRKMHAENEDSNSQSSFKDREEIRSSAYKPRTLAEKRKMLSDEQDGIEPKKVKNVKGKQKRFSRRPISSRFETTSPLKEVKTTNAQSAPVNVRNEPVDDAIKEEIEENLLVPLDESTKIIIGEVPARPNVVFLTEEESKPKDCVTSQLKIKSNIKLQTCTVVTRKLVNRTLYNKCSDIKRKASFDLIPRGELDEQRNKMSIITSSSAVTYKPGPLCRKQELQVTGCKDWATVIVDLPKVKVHVIPQVGKKLSPIVRPFVKFDSFDITKERAEYAMSVLRYNSNKKMNKIEKTDKEELLKFCFPTRYAHKQEKMMMRKIIPKIYKLSREKLIVEKPKPETEADMLNACEDVIAKMLNYIEIKDVEAGLLKYDGDAESRVEEELEMLPLPAEATVVPAKRKDYDRMYHELRRLNVRTVDLPVEEKLGVVSTCTSDEYCSLGCVCQSITSRYPPSNHCGEARCIFSCVCGFEERCTRSTQGEKETKEDSKNTLNVRTLNRYSKEAKKNITAREERDFTQTAIRSENKTIILGNNRMSKRVPKYNYKRYEGFQVCFHDQSDTMKQAKGVEKVMSETFSQKLIRTDRKLSASVVNLVRCNFDDIVPFCLVHNLYDCHCRGTAKYDPVDRLNLNNELKQQTGTEEVPVPKRTSQGNTASVEAPQGGSGGKTDHVTNPEGLSARMRGTGEFFLARNRTNKYKNIMARKLKYDTTVDAEIVNRWVILPLEVPGLNKSHTSEPKAREMPRPISVPRQSVSSEGENSVVNIDDDVNVRPGPKSRRKRKFKQVISNPNKPKGKTLKIIGTDLTISGALYSPTSVISKQFSEMINQKTSGAEFRLLLWPSMIKLYDDYAIHIWISSGSSKLRFIITDGLSNPKTGYTNIRFFEKTEHSQIKVEFIKWIITKTMPEKKNSDNILVILKIQDLFWEICGICAKNNQNAKNNSGQPLSSDVSTTSSEQYATGPVKEVIQTVSEKYYKTVQHVMFANGTFAAKQLHLSNTKEHVKGDLKLCAALPHIISDCRWRVLKVNSTFAILAFIRNEFRIKCSDILTVMKVAAKYKKTIIINTAEVSVNYQHKLFGIYIPPTFSDRIFIGPYLSNEEHGLETLRYVNNDLMNTDQFNKIRGIKNTATTGLWYQQVGRVIEAATVKPEEQSGTVIDLTDIDEVRSLMKSSDVTITPTPLAKLTTATAAETVKISNEQVRQTAKKRSSVNKPLQNFSADANNGEVVQAVADIQIPKSTNIYLKPKVAVSNVSKQTPVRSPTPALTIHNGIEHVDVNNLPKPPADRGKMPELIKIPLKPNTTNTNITQIAGKDNTDDLMDVTTLNNILSRAKHVDPENLERCFTMRLKIMMRQMGLFLPKGAMPICFRLNFGNGIILAYISMSEVYVYWPGDCNKKFCFPHLENAVEWLSQELHEVFICVPTTFRIMVTPVGPAHYLEYIRRGTISQKYFKEICIIGDFGIMRLAEAQKYLMHDTLEDAMKALKKAKFKSFKFKKAITQIVRNNDMTKTEFQQRVFNLIEKAKAAADEPPRNYLTNKSPINVSQSSSSSSVTAQSPKPTIDEDVICLDSDEDEPPAKAELPLTSSKNKPRCVVMSSKRINKMRQRKLQHRLSLQVPLKQTESALRSRPFDDSDMQRKKDVMHIDLTHLTTEKVNELLKGKGLGNNIALTLAQVNRLKALSRTPPKAKRSRNGIS